MEADNIFLAYNISVHESDTHKRLIGKFYLKDGEFHILEDHALPVGFQGGPGSIASCIHRMANSQYFLIVKLKDVLTGNHPDLIEELEKDPAGLDQQELDQLERVEFEYHRTGFPAPQRLSLDSNGGAFLDGHDLTPEELTKIRENVLTERAVLRPFTPMVKSESGWSPNKDLGFDHELPQFMNKYSFDHWSRNNEPGAHVYINGHAIGDICEQYGATAANKAVKALGKHIKDATGEAVGAKAKMFRLHGDQFLIHVPTAEHGMVLARNLRAKLEKVPAINGTHLLSASIGIGNSAHEAYASHNAARQERDTNLAAPGQGKTHINNSVLGY